MSRSFRTPRLAVPAVVAALGVALAGCSVADSSSPSAAEEGAVAASSSAAGPVVAVATTTQLASVADRVARCGGGSVVSVMGPGDDPHDVAASSDQVAQMVHSGLVFANGLGLEGGMDSALDNARQDGAAVVEVAPRLDPLPFGEHDADHAGHEGADAHAGHEHGSQDPHVWMDVARMAAAARVVGDELAAETGEQKYAECGATVEGELEETDRQVREILAAVPQERRTLVTDHDAYGYFSAAYGFTIEGVVVPGGSTDAEPSSRELAALTQQVKDHGAAALLTSAGAPNGLVETVAREAGGLPVVQLYEGGVGPAGTPEADYAQAMLHNARTLADALKG